ncbi:hypothetical protein [Dactylosporangium sp. NPDC048998]|uniref:hypothetical protein n=1 Tax=Dactylosporangium sp. NPDC048998 TaxID=3363976 RepID=UPI003720C68F
MIRATIGGRDPHAANRRMRVGAVLLKAAGADMKDIQETLGHSSITITADTYTSIHELELERAKADAAAALVPRHRKAS